MPLPHITRIPDLTAARSLIADHLAPSAEVHGAPKRWTLDDAGGTTLTWKAARGRVLSARVWFTPHGEGDQAEYEGPWGDATVTDGDGTVLIRTGSNDLAFVLRQVVTESAALEVSAP